MQASLVQMYMYPNKLVVLFTLSIITNNKKKYSMHAHQQPNYKASCSRYTMTSAAQSKAFQML